MNTPTLNESIPIALVLSSGGARGLAQIGVIEVLSENGFEIASVAGSSIGSLIGGMFAMGKLNDYRAWVAGLNRRDVFNLMDFTFSGSGLVKAEKIFQKMREFIPDILIEDMRIPFAAVATDITGETEVVFTRGSFYEAVRASIAIPAVITPVRYNSRILVDGGVLNPLPFNHVKRNPNDKLVMVNLYGHEPVQISSNEKEVVERIKNTKGKGLLDRFHNSENIQTIREWISDFVTVGDHSSKGYFSLLNTVSRLMIIRMAEQSVRLAQPDIVINIPQNSAGMWDFHKAADLIELGRRTTTETLKKYDPIKA